MDQLGASLGELVERVKGKRDEYVDYVRVRVRMDVREPVKRGSFLRLGDGSKKWVAFTYELMPLYCYLCGIVGHMEKRCPLRYREDFVDPGKDFSTNSSEMRKRKVVTPSVSRNRKNKNVEKVNKVSGRPFKKLQIGNSDNIVSSLVEAARQPHRSS